MDTTPPPGHTSTSGDQPVEVKRVMGPGTIEEADVEPVLPAGVEPFAPSEFVSFLGFEHGGNKSELGDLMPEQHATLGERTDNQMAGAAGVKFERHLAFSWNPESGALEYISVRSDKAIHHLEDNDHGDPKLDKVWNRTKGEALGILGEPTERVTQPHADAYRYEFEAADGRRGALTLLFNNLQSPPRCSRISVSWLQ